MGHPWKGSAGRCNVTDVKEFERGSHYQDDRTHLLTATCALERDQKNLNKTNQESKANSENERAYRQHIMMLISRRAEKAKALVLG